MLGPVFSADLRSHSRRPRLMILRIAFVSMLLCLFVLCYAGLPSSISKKQATVLTDFAATFAFFFMIGQFAFLMLIGPAYIASAVAEEKQRGTLDYLFSSDLTNFEIIVGKYFSRLALMVQFVLIGLPVLALTQLIGGVSLELILGMQLGTLGCLASLTALSLFMSVLSRNARDALVRTFLVLIVLLVCWFLLLQLRQSSLLSGWFAPLEEQQARYVIGMLLEMNPVFVAQLLREHLAAKGSIEGLPLRWFGLAFGLHVAVAGVLLTVSIAIVRRQFLKQIEHSVKRARVVMARTKPAVWSGYALYWKERYVHGGAWRWFGWLRWFQHTLVPSDALFTGLLAVLVSSITMVIIVLVSLPTMTSQNPALLNLSVWMIFGLLVCSTIAAVVRTASGIAVEKDRETWDVLLASPVNVSDLLLCRLYGGFLSARWLLSSSLILMVVVAWQYHAFDTKYYGQNPSNFGSWLVFGVANLGYLVFALGLAGFFSLNSSSSIRNVMSALSLLLVLNLLPLVVRFFFRGSNSTDSLVAVIYFVTQPGSMFVIIGSGCIAVLSVVLYYKMPRLRWLYDMVKWLGNLLLLNALLLLVLSGITFAFGGYVAFDRVVLFVAPLMMDYTILTEIIFPNYGYSYYSYNKDGPLLFMIASGVVFAVVGVLFYWWSLHKLKRTCGRVEHSKLAAKQRRLSMASEELLPLHPTPSL